MRGSDFISLMPQIVLTIGSLLVMTTVAIRRIHRLIYILSCLTFIIAFYVLINYSYVKAHQVQPLFVIDGFGIFNIGLILLTSLAVVMMSYAYFEQREERKGEYYILIILATLGSSVLVISKHFVSLFLGLEILSVALYGMIAYLRKRERSDEAGIKYLILAAFSSAFLLFGMALVYAGTGTMDFDVLSSYFSALDKVPVLVLTGVGLMVVGAGFKLGVVPFHMWTPDVYEGAPAPVTAFIATVSKGGMVVLLIRFFNAINGFRFPVILTTFMVISIASMFIGNFLALQQQNVKRVLAYSSIAHLGYLLVAFIAANELGVEAVSFYLVAYFVTSLGAFGIITILSDEDRDAEEMEDYRGLLWRRPWVGAIFMVMLLSLAGIPLTAGFIGKFYLIASGVDTNLWLLVIMLAVNSVIGLYYYIRIVALMFDRKESKYPLLHPTGYFGSIATLLILVTLILWFGISPQGMIGLIRSLMTIG
jgi:NADH-quinone oxidoreductase subunit N